MNWRAGLEAVAIVLASYANIAAGSYAFACVLGLATQCSIENGVRWSLHHPVFLPSVAVMAPLAFVVMGYLESGLRAVPIRLKPALCRLAVVGIFILAVLCLGFFISDLPLLIEVLRDRSSG